MSCALCELKRLDSALVPFLVFFQSGLNVKYNILGTEAVWLIDSSVLAGGSVSLLLYVRLYRSAARLSVSLRPSVSVSVVRLRLTPRGTN